MAQKKVSTSDLVFQAKLAEQAERYEDMKKYMTIIANEQGVLEVEERNLLSVAYKNIVGARRAAWRVISSLLTSKGPPERTPVEIEILKQYKIVVEKELQDLCDQILGMLEKTLIENSTGTEEKVFYLKMAGDYYRYLAEFKKDVEKAGKNPHKVASDMYNKALEVAKNGFKGDKALPKTNPILLGLTLNFSVFYYEILAKPDKACQLAKNGFDAAVDELDALEEESYKDATLIMQLLRDNLTLWTSHETDANGDYDNDHE